MIEKTFIAETWRRILAFIVDQMICLSFFIPVMVQISNSWLRDHEAKISANWLLLCFLVEILYHVLFLRLIGATVGKMIFGLRVVSYHGRQPLNWIQSILRVITDHFSLFFSQAFRALALARFDRRHVSDWVAETQVVQLKDHGVPARPRVVLAIILFFYFTSTGFFSAYRLIQRSEWSQKSIIIHATSEGEDSPESGNN